jgi:hypothetical protein
MNLVIWTLAILSIMFFIKHYLIPFLKEKIMYLKMAKEFKKMGKKYTGETGEKFKHLVEILKKAAKETKI